MACSLIQNLQACDRLPLAGKRVPKEVKSKIRQDRDGFQEFLLALIYDIQLPATLAGQKYWSTRRVYDAHTPIKHISCAFLQPKSFPSFNERVGGAACLNDGAVMGRLGPGGIAWRGAKE